VSIALTTEIARPKDISGGSPANHSVHLRSRHYRLKVRVFRERVRNRDQTCRITGAHARAMFVALAACHIIPGNYYAAVDKVVNVALVQ